MKTDNFNLKLTNRKYFLIESSKIGITGLRKSSFGTNRDKLGHGNGLYLVTDPRKCLILSIQHSTENPCVRGSIPRGATSVIAVNKGLPEI